MIFMIAQVVLGAYLRGHLERGFQGRMRWMFVLAHGIIGKTLPVLAWVQMLFGGIVALGFCHRDHFGQCLAHFIMGSAFIGYGIILTILLLVGQLWIRRKGRSQEFYDSLLISAWGCVNTFTEHRWGQPWGHNDLQHTSMGIIWWCAGLVGLWLSRDKAGRPKRNLIPGIVIFITGWAMSGHPQHLEISTKIHTVFGYTLMGAGLTRIIEISFVLKDKDSYSKDGNTINSFQYLCPFVSLACDCRMSRTLLTRLSCFTRQVSFSWELRRSKWPYLRTRMLHMCRIYLYYIVSLLCCSYVRCPYLSSQH